MELSFLGAAGEVTGSCFLLRTESVRFLVDCGLFQGGREAAGKNKRALVSDVAQLDFVLLTHAHIDHSGLIPRLWSLGFRGPIYATQATIELLSVLLPDSAYLAEATVARRTRRGGRAVADQNPTPLYTVAEAEASLSLLRPVRYDESFQPHQSIRCVFRDAAHILGAAIVEVWAEEHGRTRKLVFSGDLGTPHNPLLPDPAVVRSADMLCVESTYGNRAHRTFAATLDEIVLAINGSLASGRGNVIVPAFAVGRTQEFLCVLADLIDQGRVPPPRIFIDSPMAIRATDVTLRHLALIDPRAATLLRRLLEGPRSPVRFVHTPSESRSLADIAHGALIISASGMCEGGRILHHLKQNLSRPECGVIFPGFQALGTRGRRIVDGARSVTIHGESVPVRAKIFTIGGLSAHADQPTLLEWLANFREQPRHTFLVHGEPPVSEAFGEAIRERLGWQVAIPARGSSVIL